jgi:hypothetical protein
MENSAANLSPFMRIVVIAIMVIIPVAVVVLQRLPALKEIARRRKNGELSPVDTRSFLSFGGNNNVSVCPKCFRVNPPDNQFCGFCGTAIPCITEDN